jgi:hypothetical protein
MDSLGMSCPKAKFVILGDLNMHNRAWLGGTALDNPAGSAGHLFALANGLDQLVTAPTRQYDYDNEVRFSVLDVFLTDDPDNFEFIGAEAPVGQSDHALVMMRFKSPVTIKSNPRRNLRMYSKADWCGLQAWLAAVDWKAIIDRDIESSWSRFTDILCTAIDIFIPLKSINVERNKPWFDNSLRPLLRRKIDTYKATKVSSDQADHQAYVEARNAYNRAVRKCKTEHASDIALKLDNRTGRPWWKITNGIMGKSKAPAMPPLNDGQLSISDSTEKANLLNRLFVAKATTPHPEKNSPMPADVTDVHLCNIKFHPRAVSKLLRSIDTTKSAGLDGITGLVLQKCARVLCDPLTRLFQRSFDAGTLPSDWKLSKIIPVYKKGDKTCPANYRPVALLSVVSKIMEKYIAFHIVRHLDKERLLSDNQFGFRSGHSTLHPLLILHHLAAEALDKLQELRVVALDIAGAFDTVWHLRLLQKCKAYGLRGKLLLWLEDYLRNRQQLVSVDGECSGKLSIGAGVPQGSILGPIMFLLYINDLPGVLAAETIMFADDCTLLQPISRPIQRTAKWESLQADLDRIIEWADTNQMQFAPHKTQSMTISRRRDRANNKPLSMAGVHIAEVESLKLLGVEFAANGTVNQHILKKASTAAKLVGMLRRQSRFFSERARYHIYVATIRPNLEYASPIFVNAPRGTLQLLERVQERAALLFPSFSSRLDSMELRRNVAGLSQLFRILDNTAPNSVQRHLKPKFHHVSRTTRHSESINLKALSISKSRTDHHKTSFIPSYSRLWNQLSDETVFADSLAIFKTRACQQLRSFCSNTASGGSAQ